MVFPIRLYPSWRSSPLNDQIFGWPPAPSLTSTPWSRCRRVSALVSRNALARWRPRVRGGHSGLLSKGLVELQVAGTVALEDDVAQVFCDPRVTAYRACVELVEFNYIIKGLVGGSAVADEDLG